MSMGLIVITLLSLFTLLICAFFSYFFSWPDQRLINFIGLFQKSSFCFADFSPLFFFFSISFISALIFTSFLLLALSLNCIFYSSSLRWNLIDLRSFFCSKNILCYKFSPEFCFNYILQILICCTYSSKHFLISLEIFSLTCELFRNDLEALEYG